ncbi:MAG TPA: DUF6056 family protein [Allosphingosinicella sp.]
MNLKIAQASSRAQSIIICIFIAALLAVALSYTFIAFPALDDFWRATDKHENVASQVASLYQFWTGRWLTSLFYAVLTPRIGIFGPGYTVALLAAFLVWLSGFFLASGLLLGERASRGQVAGFAAMLFAVFWAGAPAPSEVFYWFSGAFEYGIPFLLLMVSLRLLARAVGEQPSLRHAIAAGAVGALSSGAHEAAGIVLLAAAACTGLANWHLGRKAALIPCLVTAALVAAGLAVNLLAPGNAARAAVFPYGGSLARGAALTFGFRSTPVAWLLDLRLVALTLLLLTAGPLRRVEPAWARIGLPWLVVLPTLTLGCAFTVWFLVAYSLGFPPPGRLQTLLYALFVIGWAATSLVLREKVDAATAPGWRSGLLGTCAAGLFGLALLLSANTRTAFAELPYAHGAWLAANREQLADVRTRRGRGEADIILRRVPSHPRLLMSQGLPNDPRRIENRSVARLMGVRTVRAAPGEDSGRRLWRGE